MPLSQMATSAVANRLPKVINPKVHAVIDYAMAGTFFALGAFFWRNNKRAAVGAMLCGAATAATSMLTDYPGGVKRVISFETHGKIDAGLAGLTATMPNFLAFGDEEEAKFFRGAALAETVVTGLTDFEASTGKVVRMPYERMA
ncbi:MAG: hypothetical protein JWO13_2942 [Acidobacteriales bacterium]|nr:hypothetical protein [Terriglobales bacterium]